MTTQMSGTIILIHGYGFDNRIWNPVELAFEGYHTLYLSLPGFGEEPVEEPYTIKQLAQRFWSEIDPRISPVVHLVGHSMGGYVCMEMAAQQPSRVESVALIHSHVFADPEEKKEARTNVLSDIRAHGRSGLVHKMIPSLFGNADASAALIDALIRRGMKYDDNAWYYGTKAMRDRNDHAETLRNISKPVMMIMGEKDNAVPQELAYAQAPLAERTQLLLYPEVGHLAMYENTTKMISDLVGFYKKD